MPVTPAYTVGVKYIKVAKLDSGSVDQSIQLQNLTDIRIKFSDIVNPVQYNVASIAEYPTYYLYTIVPLNITSSADQEILDYEVSASSNIKNNLVGERIFTISNYTNVTGNSLNYFTASSGYWTLGNTPNISLDVTCSVSWSYSGVGLPNNNQNISLWDTINDTYTYLSIVPSPSSQNNWTASGSVTPLENSQYIIRVDTGLQGSITSTLYSASLLITQSYATDSSNYDIVVLEPYVGANFYNSDCNVVQNNVDISTVSPFYMDVDFTNSPIVAQNQAAVLNGTATRAQVQQWNYTYFSQISGRYLGKQQNAIALNEYTGPTAYTNGTSSVYGYTGSWPGDSTSPSIPVPGNVVIQWLDSCIYEINWGGGGYPENTNGGGISVGNIYLVGETKDDVAIIKPGTDIYYDILEKTFPSGSPAFQYQYTNINALPNQLSISYPALGLPNAKYYMASNFGLIGGAGTISGYFYPTSSNIFNYEPYIYFPTSLTSSNIPNAYIDNNGYLSQQNPFSPNSDTIYTMVNQISSSLNNGDKWFISLYSGSGTIFTLTSGLPTSSNSSNLSQYGSPFEVSNAYMSGSPSSAYITLKTGSGIYDVNQYFLGSPNPLTIGLSGSNFVPTTGLLITKADYPTNGLTVFGVPSQNFGGVGPGYILSQYPKRVITENIDYILKTYGNKP